MDMGEVEERNEYTQRITCEIPKFKFVIYKMIQKKMTNTSMINIVQADTVMVNTDSQLEAVLSHNGKTYL